MIGCVGGSSAAGVQKEPRRRVDILRCYRSSDLAMTAVMLFANHYLPRTIAATCLIVGNPRPQRWGPSQNRPPAAGRVAAPTGIWRCREAMRGAPSHTYLSSRDDRSR